ncbi:MAG: hypothetical protein A3J37_08465 [Alphaproteobacteria bacterium RIFCSPHIGHO2_12_FULL_45_9]|nr:MAG: hypothetical protein A3B66_06850 [Alphaproteobacteria bacterium RIFCSPHIGHO2_02_FULL_46_13]OFW94468.1 MAG: hypothetical protein A3J37_08465 [Alphaproteobacteria bacterium RIFCSPHIGHO2_12_FULL_45_9]
MKRRIHRAALIPAMRGFERDERVPQFSSERRERTAAYIKHLLSGMQLNKGIEMRVFNTVALIEKSGTPEQKDRLSDLQAEMRVCLATIFQAVGLARCDFDEQRHVLTRKLLERYPLMTQSIAVAEARSFCLSRIPE